MPVSLHTLVTNKAGSSCHVFFITPPSGTCASSGVACQAGSCSTARYGSISLHHIQDTATSPSAVPGTSPYRASLCIPGSLSCSYGRKCGSACRGSSNVDRGNPGIRSRTAPAPSSAVHTVFCGDNSSRPAGTRHSTSSQTPFSSGRSSSPGSWNTGRSSSRKEQSVVHS
jgi:hypothetical protein